MGTLSTSEEFARALLAIFRGHNCASGRSTCAKTGQHAISDLWPYGGRANDYASAVQYAEEQGWLQQGPNNTLRLTQAGFDAM